MNSRKIVAAAAVVGAIVLFLSNTGVTATHEPADKVAASGSTAVVISPAENVTLLSEKIRTSAPSDLLLGVTAECVITTELTTVGNDVSSAEGRVRVWVEFDGTPVPVSADDAVDPGRVTFCNRFEERETTNFDDEDATIRTLHEAGIAGGFNWLKIDTGPGLHTITVKATLSTAATDNATALAAVGKRTLIIEPTKAANDETVTEVG